MSLRTVIGGVGAAVGFAIGGLAGAHFGWALGSVAGNIADPRTVKGPQIGEISSQTSQEGGPRPIVFGLSPPMTGNIIATSNPVVSTQRSGKGGPSVETETVSRTYAVGVAEGPIPGFIRVWRNNKLVYDGTEGSPLGQNPHADGFSGGGVIGDAIGEFFQNAPTANERFLRTARFFLGEFDQNPSPDLEVIFGVGTTPAHRGTAYMVMVDEDLTDMGGAIPQWQFQIGASGAVVTLFDEPGGFTFNADATKSYKGTTVAGGGGGQSGSLSSLTEANWRGTGGGGGGRSVRTYAVGELSGSISLTVGAGGVGGASTTGNTTAVDLSRRDGAPGGASTFYSPSPLTAGGGGGGGNATIGNGGSGGAGSTGNGGSSGITPSPSESSGAGGIGGNHNANFTVSDAIPGGSGNSSNPLTTAAGGAFGGQSLGGNGNPGSNGQYNDEVGGGGGGGGSAFHTTAQANDGGRGGAAFRGGGGGGGGPGAWYGAVMATSGEGGKGGDGYVRLEQQATAPCTTLIEIVTSICERAGLPSDLIDTSLLPDVCVDGLTITNQYPAVEALRSLGQVYLFDASSYDSQVHFIPRGGNSVATITENDMVEDDGTIEQVQRQDAISIPRILNLNYYDSENGGLATAKQTSERAGDRRSLGDSSIQTPVVMTSDLAAKTVNIQHKVMIEETKAELKFSLPDSFLRLVPSNPIIVQWNGRSERTRILQLDIQDGYQEYVCGRDRQSAYTSMVEGIPPAPPIAPPSDSPGPTLITILDIHLLQDADDNVGMAYYVAVSGVTPAWSGAVVELSYDGGANYVQSQNAQVSAVIGELATSLPDHPAQYPDVVSSFTVDIYSPDPELEETDLAGMMNRANLAIVDDEIINFATVNENSAGQWELSTLLRGRKGTEAVAHSAGARFVLLQRNVLAFIPTSVADIGRTLTFRATSYGTATDTGTVVSIDYEGNIQRERAVAYLSARRDSGNAIVEWQGVGRLGAGGAVAQGVRFTGYQVTFSDGVAADIVVNTLAQTLTQDLSSFSNPVTITVVQVNELTGNGPSQQVTI